MTIVSTHAHTTRTQSIRSVLVPLLAALTPWLPACGPPTYPGPVGTPPECEAVRGDVAGPLRVAAFGDYGKDNRGERDVAELVGALDVDIVVTTGDNIYDSTDYDTFVGQYYHEYIGNYSGRYGAGAAVNRFFPTLGNHDDLAAYEAFFDLPGIPCSTSGTERYYDFVQGPVHFFAIESSDQRGLSPLLSSASTQGRWLRAQLEASTTAWQIVAMHHAPWSSSDSHGSLPNMQWPFEQWGADVVLAGHDHTYERILRDDDGDGVACVYLVTGLGGKSKYGFPADPAEFVAGSAFRYNAEYGTVLIEATSDTLRCSFHSIADGANAVDSYELTR